MIVMSNADYMLGYFTYRLRFQMFFRMYKYNCIDTYLVLMHSGTDLCKSTDAYPLHILMHSAVFVEAQTKMILIAY